jgi:hypothetical protein
MARGSAQTPALENELAAGRRAEKEAEQLRTELRRTTRARDTLQAQVAELQARAATVSKAAVSLVAPAPAVAASALKGLRSAACKGVLEKLAAAVETEAAAISGGVQAALEKELDCDKTNCDGDIIAMNELDEWADRAAALSHDARVRRTCHAEAGCLHHSEFNI